MFDKEMWEYTVMEIEKPSKVLVIEDKDPKNFHYIYVLKKKVAEPPKKEEEEKKEEEKKEEEKIIQRKKNLILKQMIMNFINYMKPKY